MPRARDNHRSKAITLARPPPAPTPDFPMLGVALLFIGAVLIAHVIGVQDPLTLWGAALYFWARVVYVPLYAFGVPYLRTVVFLVSLVGLLMVIAAPLLTLIGSS